jgi:hypothetical protein
LSQPVHEWPSRDGESGADESRQPILAIAKRDRDDADQNDHGQRCEQYDAIAAERDSERPLQRRLAFPKLNQRAKLEKKRERIEEHIGNDQSAEGYEYEDGIKDR